jgi:hypothetical protein
MQWSAIKGVINLCLDKIAPIKQVNVRATVNLPWYDKQLINLAHKRNRLYNKWYDNKTQIDRAKYVESRNKYNSVFRDKKSNYYKEFVCENSASTKSFWQKLNPFLNPNKKEKISASLLSNKENNIHSSQDLVEAFSNFFSSILTKLKFVNINDCKRFVINHFTRSHTLANLIPSDLPKFDFGLVPEKVVLANLSKMNSKSAPGSVDIESIIFKQCSAELTPPLTGLFNWCIKSNTIGKQLTSHRSLKVKATNHPLIITDRYQYYLQLLKFLKQFLVKKLDRTLKTIIFFMMTKTDLEKVDHVT